MTGDCSRRSYWKFRGRLISWTSWLAEHLRCKESVNRPRLITARRERITVSGCGCWRRWQVKGSAVVKARKNARGLSRRPSWKREKAQQAAYQAEQAVLSKRTLALRAQQNDTVVQMLKTELAAQKEKMLKLARVVKVLIQELIKAAPERAHALGLIKTEPVLQRKPERGKGYSFER